MQELFLQTSGVHAVPEGFSGRIRIDAAISVILEDFSLGGDCEIVLEERAECTYLGISGWAEHRTIRRFSLQWDAASADIRLLSVSLRNDSNIDVTLEWNGSSVQLRSLSLLREGAKESCQAVIRAAPANRWENGESIDSARHAVIRDVHGSIDLKNIFLGQKADVRCLPRLLVESDRASASHGASFDRLSESELFFLMMRGMSRVDAQQFLLHAKVRDLFSVCSCGSYECVGGKMHEEKDSSESRFEALLETLVWQMANWL